MKLVLSPPYTIVEQNQLHQNQRSLMMSLFILVTVTVTKDATGQLNADVQYDGKKDTLLFTNTYTPPTPPTQVKNKLPQVRF